jgi:hypothetical protein
LVAIHVPITLKGFILKEESSSWKFKLRPNKETKFNGDRLGALIRLPKSC